MSFGIVTLVRDDLNNGQIRVEGGARERCTGAWSSNACPEWELEGQKLRLVVEMSIWDCSPKVAFGLPDK